MQQNNKNVVNSILDIPNVGKKIAGYLKVLEINRPDQLRGTDPFVLYTRLCEKQNQRYDPCLLDTFMAAVDFMNGAEARPWWRYTAERKKRYNL